MRSLAKSTGLAMVALLVVAAGCAGGAGGGADGRVALSVTEDGFVPKSVTVKAGSPVTLVVTRKTEKTCATELVLAEYGIKQDLPLDQAVEITFTPQAAGELTYACAMNMIKGKVVVE